MSQKVLDVEGISKRFAAVQALNKMHLDLYAGEVLGICGENGAGKSTLIKCLGGVYTPDEGTIRICGETVRFHNEQEALDKGISIIYQELSVIRPLNIAQNIFLGRIPHKNGFVNTKELREKTQEILDEIGLKKDPIHLFCSDLNISEQQMVEIGKAISRHPKILIMDEPTSSLGQDETKRLFALIRKLRDQGYGIIYISHHMEEIFEITDRVLVLRDGEFAGCKPTREWDVDSLIFAMVNRQVDRQFPQKRDKTAGELLLDVDGLNNKEVRNISLRLHRGEIVGLAGIVGAGRSEVLKSIFGVYNSSSKKFELKGRPVRINTPHQAIANGISYMSEDRRGDMLSVEASIKDNMILSYLSDMTSRGLMNQRKINQTVREGIEAFNIKLDSPEDKVSQLSGGNQQKVLLARITHGEPDIFLLDEPTRGIDVSVKQELYNRIIEFANEGKGVLLVTSELPELTGLADRVYVMRNHTIVKELSGKDINRETIMFYAAGGSNLNEQ